MPGRTREMARAKTNLMDEDNGFIVSLERESDDEHHTNSWLQTDDGGIYVIAEVRPGPVHRRSSESRNP